MAVGMFLFSAVDATSKISNRRFAPFSDCLDKTAWAGLWHLSFAGDVWPSYLHYNSSCSATGTGILAAGSATLFIIAISQVPLADAITVTFIAPLVVTMLSAVLLAEKVGLHRWAQSLPVLRVQLLLYARALKTFTLPCYWCFGRYLFAGRQIISRLLSSSDNVYTTVAYTALASSVMLSVPAYFVWITRRPTSSLSC